MSKFTPIDEALHDYMVGHGAREDAVLAAVRAETEALGPELALMQIAPDQGALLRLLTLMLGARRALEIGTFTGYSAICIARGLREGGRLLACELDPDRARTARRNFERAAVAAMIELRVGPAAATLADLENEQPEPFDLAFVDADKTGYDAYYESCLRLLRPGGLIVLDNVLQDGRVLHPGEAEGPQAIDALNRKLRNDDRVELAMIGVADGLTLALKR